MTIDEMRERKRELGYTAKELSELSGIPLGTLQKILGGATTSPKRSTILALEKVLKREDKKSGSGLEEGGWPMGVRETPADYPYWQGVSLLRPEILRESAQVRPLKQQGEYTVSDYFLFPESQRVELIDGVIYNLAVPSFLHQSFVSEISYQLTAFVKGNHGKCKVFQAPINVQLDKDDRTMVQPDIAIFCHLEDLYKKVYFGAPDMIIEVVSPSSRNKDMFVKLQKYAKAGVREYWLVYPEEQRVVVFRDLPENTIPCLFSMQGTVPVGIWEDDCRIDFAKIVEESRVLYERPEAEQGDVSVCPTHVPAEED